MSLFDNCISPEVNESIYAIPSEQEIFFVLTSIGSIKALGLDGFTALFYKKYWSIVKDVVLSSIWYFFGNNRLLKEQNQTFIALIPKQMSAFSVQNSNPLACAISFIRLSQKFWLIGLKLCFIFLFLLFSLHLCPLETFKIILLWLGVLSERSASGASSGSARARLEY
jgi:hypothetical protein